MSKKRPNRPNDEPPFSTDLDRAVAEARRIMGIDGPRRQIVHEGHLYRLVEPQPVSGDAEGAHVWSESLYIVVNWLHRHPAIAQEIDAYGIPTDQMEELPFVTRAMIFVGLGLEAYAANRGVRRDPAREEPDAA